MAFYGLQMQRKQGANLPGTETAGSTLELRRLEFDETIIPGGQDSPITYAANGLFTISSSGNYFISWFVTCRTGLVDPGVQFALIESHLNGTETVTTQYPCTNSMKTGQVNGTAIINVPTDKTYTFGIYNMGKGEVTLASYAGITPSPITANITIHPYTTGSYSSSYGLIGLTLTRGATATDTVLVGQSPVIFDDEQIQYPDNFDYDPTTGVIMLKKAGNYMINWSVNLDGSEDANCISFSLIAGSDPSTGDELARCDSTLLMQQSYSGYAFLSTTKANTTFQLINTTKKINGQPATLTYSSIATKASIRIIGHS